MPSAFNTSKQKELHLKATEGIGLADADIPKAVKQTIRVPKTYFDMLSMTQIFYNVIILLFGNTSALAEGLKSCICHMINFSTLYESRQLDDPTFLTQVLFDIDSAVQLHLQSCERFENREQVNDVILCFDQAHNDIQRRKFTCIIQDFLKIKFSTDEPRNIKHKDRLRDNIVVAGLENGSKNPNGAKRLKNETNKKWLLRNNENFHETFNKFNRHAPKSPEGRLICLNWFIKGFCVEGCKREHGKLTGDVEKSFDKFIRVCRHNFNNPDNTQDF